MSLNKSVLFCYGEGGHEAQINRLSKHIKLDEFEIITLSDSKRMPSWSNCHIVTNEVRGKYGKNKFSVNLGMLKIVRTVLYLLYSKNFKIMISTGPGISVVCAILFRLFGKKVIHVETWSRFSTASLTGRVMYILANKFYVQHKSLLRIYPKAIYSGLL